MRRAGAILALALAALVAGCGESRAMQPPPPPRWEQPTAAPKAPSAWVRGHWDWDGSQWSWIAGEWRKKPSPESSWQDGHYGRRADGSWEWLPGRWRDPGDPGYAQPQ